MSKKDTDSMETNSKGRKLLQELYDIDGDNSDFDKISKILAEFRVITREKTLSPELLDDNCIETLVKYAKERHTEAQKSISNIILNYEHFRQPLIKPYTECVKDRLTQVNDERFNYQGTYSSKKQLNEVLYYDLRIISLLSALCPASQAQIREQLVDLILHVISREANNVTEDNLPILIEGLKTVFNLTISSCVDETLACNVILKLFEAAKIEDETNNNSETKSQHNQLLVSLIHLLTNMPKEVYFKLTNDKVDKILVYLNDQLKTNSILDLKDSLPPVLNVCANLCKFNEEIRRNWFNQIMASSNDFEKRPEEYNTLRGRLVKLMTSVHILQKDMAAYFLHELCGQDTEKFITYTGFGNAAAFLSARGLLNRSGRSENNSCESKEDDSYHELRDKLDPITGKINVPRENPMDKMSQEEKEYHANELADAIAKLTNLGVIKPMQLDASGNVSEIKPRDPDQN